MEIKNSRLYKEMKAGYKCPVYIRRTDLFYAMNDLKEELETELEDLNFEYDVHALESKFDKHVLPANSVISNFTQDFDIVFTNMMRNVLGHFPVRGVTMERLYENVDSIEYSYQPDCINPTITAKIECTANGKFMGDIAETLDDLPLYGFSCKKETNHIGDILTDVELIFPFDGLKKMHYKNYLILPEMTDHLIEMLHVIDSYINQAEAYKDTDEKDYYCFMAMTEFLNLASMIGYKPEMKNQRFWTKNKIARRCRNGFGLFTDETISSLKKAVNK